MKKIISLIIIILFLSGIQNSGMTKPMNVMLFGDLNNDAVVDMKDYNIVLADAQNFVTGSTTTDLNGDGVTNLMDLLIVWNLFH